ncbi:MAG: hypothetical protein M1833_004281 [Piccolia ochrophora]|nr:MAG: hypothetical protein M1833_004281 [Piccolia ochrophora]
MSSMFARLRGLTTSLLSRPSSSAEQPPETLDFRSHTTGLTGREELGELQLSPVDNMVQTRRQARSLNTDSPEASSPSTSPSNSRKRQSETSQFPESTTKRRRTKASRQQAPTSPTQSEASEDPLQTSEKVLPVRSKEDDDYDGVHGHERLVEGNDTERSPHHDHSPSKNDDHQEKSPIATSKQTTVQQAIETATNTDRGQAERETPSKLQNDLDHDQGIAQPQAISQTEEDRQVADADNEEKAEAKSKHIRFESEDPGISGMDQNLSPNFQTANGNKPSIEMADDHSDEAPEAESLQAAQSKARSREAQTSKVEEEHKAATKRKRKDRDTRLKGQAASSQKRRKREVRNDLSLGSTSENLGVKDKKSAFKALEHPSLEGPRTFSTNSIPALLPAELLETEPPERPPTPPMDTKNEPKRPKKIKFLDVDERRPKDVKRGRVKVRVLETFQEHLAPKVGKESKGLKEAWLAGRQAKGGSGVQRRSIHRGFLRR